MSKTLQTRIQLKHDIESNWIAAGNKSNFIPLAGEIIIYDDLQKIKIGDGQKNINELDFITINPTEFDNLDTAKMDKENPTGTGSFSLNRAKDSAIGSCSFSEGQNTTASGNYSHAEGYSTTASGSGSHAEGRYSKANSDYSHAEGDNTQANDWASHAEGHNTIAGGFASHAEGNYTKAFGIYQHVQGKFNINDRDKYAHIVGNGESTAPSNAHTLDWDGNAWFAGDVYVGSNTGTNKDDGSKKLATEEYVNEAIAGNGSSGIYVQATAPENPKGGDIWVDTDDVEQTVLAAVATSGSFNDLTNKPTYGIADITNLQTELNKKANDFSLELYNGTSGNPKPVKFMTVNYSTCGSENGVAIKLGIVSGHGNGSSYAFLQDAIIKVTHTGDVAVDNFKYYGASAGTYDSATRQYGDIFWVIDTTNKIVDFYCLMGQYARLQMTPYKRVTYSTGGTITQYTSATVYSSGTKVWANNNEIATLADIPSLSNYALKTDIPSLSGYATQTWVQQQIAAIAIYNGSVS